MNYMLMMQSQLPQILKESLFPSSLFVWDVLKPYIISIIVGGIIIFVIKKIIGECVYRFVIISGDTHRTAKRKATKAGNIVDLASAMNDI